MAGPDPGCPGHGQHGTSNAYWNHGCRCPQAIEAFRLHRRQLRRGHRILIPALGTQRRLRALTALGWPTQALADRLGCTPDHIRWYRRAHDAGRLAHRDHAHRIAHLYEQLSGTPGPSPTARADAARRGWAPPLAWDDIDDPDATPYSDPPAPRGTASTRIHLDDVDHLARFGLSTRAIAHRLGVDPDSITQARRRATHQEGGRRAS